MPNDADGLPPGLGYLIANNQFKFTQSIAIGSRLDAGTIITGNRIEDFGYRLDGVTPHGSQVYGIVLNASKHCVITNNWVEFKDWTPPSTPTSTWGIFMAKYVFNSITTNSVENLITGNVIENVDYGIREETAADANNVVHGNAFNNIRNKAVDIQSSDAWRTPFYIGRYALFVDASGRLRIKNGMPTSDTDGAIVGTQT